MRNAVSEMTEVCLAQYVMGTVVEVTLFPVCGEAHARDAAAGALREFERIEGIFSRFDPSSELSRVNSQAGTHPVNVSDEFFGLAARGLQYSRHSDSAFSITLQPLVRLWERSAEAERLPSHRQIDSALALGHPEGVILDAARRSVHFAVHGMSLNFDGLAKGYATDRARAVLSEEGFTRAMIDAGSSSIAVLHPAGGLSPWRLAVRHPVQSGRSVACLSLNWPALSTSGTGERGFTIAGRWFSHLIDPFSGFPVEELASATAVGDYAELLEVASKLLLLRGCEKGLRICDNLGWSVDAVTVRQAAVGDQLWIQHPDSLSIETEPEYDADSTCVH
jgi:thiamine biosynthesis lipoprotein